MGELNWRQSMRDLDKLVEMFNESAKTDSYKITSFRIDVSNDILEVMTEKEIEVILGSKRAKRFLKGDMSPKNTIITLVELLEAQNIRMRFVKI